MKRFFASIQSALFVGLLCLSSTVYADSIKLRDLPEKFHAAYALNGDHSDPNEGATAAAAVAELYADITSLGGDFFGGAVLTSPAMVEGNELFLFSAFCDTNWEATNVVIDNGDKEIAIEYDLTATFCEPLALPTGTIPPNGNTMTLKLSTFIKIDSQGKIISEYRHANLQAFFDAVLAP